MATVQENVGTPDIGGKMKNVAKKSTSKPSQFILNGQVKMASDSTPNALSQGSSPLHNGDCGRKRPAEDEDTDNPAKVARQTIEHIEKRQEEELKLLTGRESPATPANQEQHSNGTLIELDSTESDNDPIVTSITDSSTPVNATPVNGKATKDNNNDDSNSSTVSQTGSKPTKLLPGNLAKLGDNMKNFTKNLIEAALTKVSTGQSSTSNSGRSSPAQSNGQSNKELPDKGNLFEKLNDLNKENSDCEMQSGNADDAVLLLDETEEEGTDVITKEKEDVLLLDTDEDNVTNITKEKEDLLLQEDSEADNKSKENDVLVLDDTEEESTSADKANKEEEKTTKKDDTEILKSDSPTLDTKSIELVEVEDKTKTKLDDTKEESIADVTEPNSESKAEVIDTVKTDDQKEEDSDVLQIDIQEKDKNEEEKVTKAEVEGNKTSHLDEVIGRLGSQIGITPDQVKVDDEIEEVLSDDEIETIGETKNEDIIDDKVHTLTTRELNKLIAQKLEDYIKTSHKSLIGEMQSKIDKLQNSVESWRNQAKELQKQVLEIASKQQQRELRRAAAQHKVASRHMGIRDTEQKVQAVQYQKQQQQQQQTTTAAGSTTVTTVPGKTTTHVRIAPTATATATSQAAGTGPPYNGGTVRDLLNAQRAMGNASKPGTPGPEKSQAPPKAAAKAGGAAVIDLTDDDDAAAAPKQGTATVQNRTVVQQNIRPQVAGQQGVPQTVNTLRPGMLVQQVPIRTPNGQLVYQTRPGTVMMQTAPGTSLVRQTLVTNQPLRPGQIMVRTNGPVTTNRGPPPLQSAPHSLKHPAPLPQPPNYGNSQFPKQPPPKPSLKISRVQQGIVLSWNMTLNDTFTEIATYQLFAYQESSALPATHLWKKVGDVKALPLPMACTLTQFQEGNKYHFAVRGVDKHGRVGAFSDPNSIHLVPNAS